MFDASFFWGLFPIMFRYIDTTLGISLASLLLALLIAFIIAGAYYLEVPVLKEICGAWVSIFRGTPLLAQLFWICYGLPQLIVPMQKLSTMTLIIWGVAFNASSYMSETLRGALSSVNKGQMEGCLACGMTRFQGFFRIVLPQAVRVAVPGLSNNFVDIIKQSSLAFTLGVTEIMAVAKMEGSTDLKFLESFTAVMIVYWLIVTFFNYVQKLLEKWLSRMY
ncbi:amino acid ABC transporter permease [uncultured Negativibacillus sp.]|uniref:amino acid ABC transporter permease n=1 Tax=uncultured Negativibacillus sp. TaxID=1980696 RepID=UPI002600DD91|nr:amino acid ABC transporter permease [uncultured Negativibacillus sp.]